MKIRSYSIKFDHIRINSIGCAQYAQSRVVGMMEAKMQDRLTPVKVDKPNKKNDSLKKIGFMHYAAAQSKKVLADDIMS